MGNQIFPQSYTQVRIIVKNLLYFTTLLYKKIFKVVLVKYNSSVPLFYIHFANISNVVS
jgi:hypothetical protein